MQPNIIHHSLLLPTDTLLRLGVVQSEEEISDYKGHYDALYNRLYTLITDALPGNPQLATTIGNALQLPETAFYETEEVAVLVDLILESDQMIGLLSDLRKNWSNLDETEIEAINQITIELNEESREALANEKAKAYLNMELEEYLEVLSMYLNT